MFGELTLRLHRLIIVDTNRLQRPLLQIALSSQSQRVRLAAQRCDTKVLKLNLIRNRDSLRDMRYSPVLSLDLWDINEGERCLAAIQVEGAVERFQCRVKLRVRKENSVQFKVKRIWRWVQEGF